MASGAEILWEIIEVRGTLTAIAEAMGKLCVVPEIGGAILDVDYFDRAVARMVNMLKVVDVFAGTPHTEGPRVVVRKGASLRPSHGGTFIPIAGLDVLGKSVSQGTVLGRVVSPYDFEQLDEIVAPFARKEVMQVRNRISKVHPGEYAYMIGDGESGYAP